MTTWWQHSRPSRVASTPVTSPSTAMASGRESGIEGYDSFLEYVSHPLEHHHAVALAKLIPPASRLSTDPDSFAS